jgi:YVTN family beta-propeller protein
VAAISTADWKVMANIETGANPGRLALQPDGEYLWVAYRDPKPGADRSGVTAIEVETLRRAADIPTGNGDHDMVLDDDGRLYVTDPSDGAVTVVDTGALEVIRKIETAAEPASLAYTPAGQAVYVSHRSGWITAIDADRLEVTARIEAEPGLGDIRFVPETRLALVVNPAEDVLHIVDAAARKIVQTGDMEDEPDQIGLSDELAYVRHRKSEHILMIPLDEIGREGAPVPVIDFPGGQHPAGGHASPTPARGIVQAPGATAVLVANPGDEALYYYKEGMAAPMGHFKNYDRAARAVMVVDRSLREVAPGTYETAVTLRRSGEYDLAFFLDSPRIVHCFDFPVAENPELVAERQARERPFEVRYRLDDAELTVGREETVRFQLVDSLSDTPQGDREDVEVLTFLAPGIWQKRHVAEPVPAGDGDGEGLYEIRFTPPRSGVYYIFVQSHGLGFGYQRSPYVALQAVETETVANTDGAAPEALKEE